MKRRRYWAVAYGRVIRWAGPCETQNQAAMEAFGVNADDRTTIMECPNPKYMAYYKKREFLEKLEVLHKQRTGNVIS